MASSVWVRRHAGQWAGAVFVAAAGIGLHGSLVLAADTSAAGAPYRRAERIEGLKGVGNVGRVAPGLYRGGAPSREGLDALKALGVRTVVNLRHYHGSREERWCRQRGLQYVRIVTASSDQPKDEDVRRFLQVVTDPSRQPVYVHCLRGKDRTGMMCAVYRMAVEGWPVDAARAEMQAFGFFDGWRDLLRYVEAFPARKHRIWPAQPSLSLSEGRAFAADTPREARVSLDVKDTDVHDLVAALLQVSGLQSVFDPAISCRLTLKVHELSWRKAFETTLSACGLGYEAEGTVVRIATRERLGSEAAEGRRLAELKQETRSNRVALVRLSYARAREMAPLLKKLLQARADVVYDERTNTLIILD